MSNENLQTLVRIGKLAGEPASRAEFEGMTRSGWKRLQDADNDALNVESRFDLAYNAASSRGGPTHLCARGAQGPRPLNELPGCA